MYSYTIYLSYFIDIMASSHLELSVHFVSNNNSDAPIKVW